MCAIPQVGFGCQSRREVSAMLEMVKFCLTIGVVMTIGYACGAIAFRLQEKYYGKEKNERK